MVPCGCLAAAGGPPELNLPPHRAVQLCLSSAGRNIGNGETHANPHVLSKLSLHDAATLGLWLWVRNTQSPSLS